LIIRSGDENSHSLHGNDDENDDEDGIIVDTTPMLSSKGPNKTITNPRTITAKNVSVFSSRPLAQEIKFETKLELDARLRKLSQKPLHSM
jgi:hypothetical protein